MRHVMAVYDVDPFYASRFADVVNQKEKIPFEVLAFSSLEKLKKYAGEHTVELLLISGAVNREEVDALRAEKVIVLADGETVQADMEYPSIYKYQSSENIVREVMACYCEKEPETGQNANASLRKRAAVLGVFSPLGRCLKTSFAITMGQLLSQLGHTLYLNLEECSGLAGLTHEDYRTDLSDLLYFYCQGSYSLLRLNSVVHSMGGLDYVPPARYPEDLSQADPAQITGLIDKIAMESAYETVILDIGSFVKTAIPVLNLCTAIYMPVKEDSVSLAKLEEFDRYLDVSGNAYLKERIRRLKLPYHSSFGRRENYLEQLLWGELGDYVRQLLKGRFRNEEADR